MWCAATARAADGDLDPNFGTLGTVVTPVGSDADSYAVTTDAQGRIVAVGTAEMADQDMAVARYLPNGAVDASFSGDGIATFDLPGGGDEEFAYAVTIDAGGGILAAGCEGGFGFVGLFCDDFTLIRVSGNGALDTSFGPPGSSGIVRRDLYGQQDTANAIALDAQGRIIVGGTSRVGGDYDFGVVRFSSTGNPDANFGTGGKTNVDFTPVGSDNDYANAMVIDGQGRIVLAGVTRQPSIDDFALARLSGDGILDPGFGNTPGKPGQVTTPIGSADDVADAVTVDAQGRIVAAGHAQIGANVEPALARYNPDGSLDTSFSDDGKVVTPSPTGAGGLATGVGIDSQGRIVAAGYAITPGTGASVLVSRYGTGGALDQGFGQGGTTTGPSGIWRAATIDSVDRIVVAGNAPSGGNDAFALVRLIGDAVAPTVTIGSGPAEGSFTNDPTPIFDFTASEPGGTFGCGFDGLSATCASPFAPSAPLGDGRHTFAVTATDRAGNNSAPTTRTFTIDTREPDVDISGKGKVKTRKKKVRVELKIEASEPAELTCVVDNGGAEECVGRFVTPKLKRGKHTVTVTATDQAGNASTETKTIKVVRKR